MEKQNKWKCLSEQQMEISHQQLDGRRFSSDSYDLKKINLNDVDNPQQISMLHQHATVNASMVNLLKRTYSACFQVYIYILGLYWNIFA